MNISNINNFINVKNDIFEQSEFFIKNKITQYFGLLTTHILVIYNMTL